MTGARGSELRDPRLDWGATPFDAPSSNAPARASGMTAGVGDRALDRPGSVVILGNYRAALTTARRLSARGCRVVLAAEPGTTCAEFSRHVDDVWRCPPFAPDSEAFIEALLEKVTGLPRPVTVMPVLERPMDVVAAFEQVLDPYVRIALPEARVIRTLHDKHASLACARDAGLAVPPFALCHGLPDLRRAVARIGLPVVVRPTVAGTRIGTKKAVTLWSLDDIDTHFPDANADVSGLLVQRRFVGLRTNVYFAARDGRILAEQHSKSVRTDRADGTGQTIEGITIPPIPCIARETAMIVAHLNYTGVGCAQFLYDEARDQPCYLEINARFGASYAFIERIGMGLTDDALNLAWNDPRPVDPRLGQFDVGTRFVWTLGDVSGLLYGIRRREVGARGALAWLGHILLAAVRAQAHVTWSWRDPLPTTVLYARAVAGTLGLRRRGLPKPS